MYPLSRLLYGDVVLPQAQQPCNTLLVLIDNDRRFDGNIA